MALGNIDSLPQKAAPTRPRWGHFMGRLIWVYPKGVKPPNNGMGESIICDVAFFDGGPMTHVTGDDGTITPLANPVQPGEVIEDVYVGSTRFKDDLKAAIGQHDGFICRLGKDGNAAVLKKATPQEQEYGARWVEQHRGRQQQIAQAADPFRAAQQQLAAQQGPGIPHQQDPAAYLQQGPQQFQPAPASYSPVQAQYGTPAPQPAQAPFVGQPGGPPAVPGAQPAYNPNQGYGQPQTAPTAPVQASPQGPPAGAPPFDPAAWAAFQAAQGQSGQPPF